MNTTSPTVRTLLLTAVAPAVWGSTYAVTQLWLPPGRPLFAATARVLPAGLLLLLWVRRLPRGGWWGRAVVLGGLNHGLFFGLLYLAAFRLPSSLASTLTALSPLVVMAMAFLVLGERQTSVTLLAALVGVVGVVTLVWQSDRAGGAVDALGIAAAVGAVVSSAFGFALVRRWSPPDNVLATTSWQLVAGGLLLLPVAAVVEGAPPVLDAPAVAALAYLGLVGSALGYLLWFRGLTRMDAGAVAVVGLVNPVVGTVLGVLLLAEPFGPVHAVAIVVTLGSVLLAQAPVRRGLRLPRWTGRHPERTSAAGPEVLAEAAGAAPRHTVGACPT